MQLTTRAARSDAGFTLIELLIVVAITGIVGLPLVDALTLYFRNTDATSAQMALSHDAQISAAYVASDLAGTGLRDTSTTGPGGTIPFKSSIQLNTAVDATGQSCGAPVSTVAKIALLSDDWNTSTSPATRSTRIVAYYLAPGGTVSQLHRLVCDFGAVKSDIVVAHNVDDGDPTAAPPRASTFVVKCDGSTDPAACTGTAVPQTVELDFSVTLPGADAYPIALTGQRRQQ